MGEFWNVNADSFPIVVTVAPQTFTEPGVEQYRQAYVEVLDRREPFVSIVDTRECVGFMDSENRRHLARFGDSTREARRNVVLAIIVLTSDVLLRASIRAMHWLSRPEQPVHFVGDVDDAIAIALSVLDANRVERPSSERLEGARERMKSGGVRASA